MTSFLSHYFSLGGIGIGIVMEAFHVPLLPMLLQSWIALQKQLPCSSQSVHDVKLTSCVWEDRANDLF